MSEDKAAVLTDEEASALITDPRLRQYILSINIELEMVLDWLKAWQNWNRQMHHELHIGDLRVLPDDTKGRRELADRLRAGVVAADAVARLRAERNAVGYDCTLLAKALVDTGASRHPYIASVRPVIERHYRPGELEPNGDTVPHPYLMTPELAAALSGLCVAEDPDPEHQATCHVDTLPEVYLVLSKAVERVTDTLRAQQPEIG